MKRITISLLLVSLSLLLCSCACQHEWVDADCTSPKTCALCAETEGETLGHSWMEATCETAQTCSRCNVTDGNPLGHTPGEWEVIEQPLFEKEGLQTRSCTVCNAQIESERIGRTPPIGNGLFTLTPIVFSTEVTIYAEEIYPDLSFQSGSLVGDDGVMKTVALLDEELIAVIWYCDTNGDPISEFQNTLKRVKLDAPVPNTKEANDALQGLISSIISVCDPTLSKEDAINCGRSFYYYAYEGIGEIQSFAGNGLNISLIMQNDETYFLQMLVEP